MNNSFRRIITTAFPSFLFAAFLSSANAEIVTFYFEGPVTSNVGDFVTGSVTFDTSTPPTPDSPDRYVYFDAVTSLSFSTNGVNEISRTFNCGHAQTWNDWSETKDLLHFSCSITPQQHYTLATFGVNMLTSLDLPTEPPNGERIDFFWMEYEGGPELTSNDISWVHPATAVDVDIKPDNKYNIINPRAKGVIWVAVLSDTDPESPFDPSSQVDIPTVEFGPDGAKATRYKVKDINKDGLGDLLLRFKIQKTGIACGDTEATLTGEIFDGLSFSGTDSIKTVGCKPKKHHKKHHDKHHDKKYHNMHHNKHHDDDRDEDHKKP